MVKAENEDIVGRMQQATLLLIENLGMYSKSIGSYVPGLSQGLLKSNIGLQISALTELYEELN